MAKKRLTREESRARTRQELLRAAGRLFLRDGYTATSLAAVAEEAAMTKGAVYSNFDSKEDLFLALLMDRGHEDWYAPQDLSEDGTPLERARAFGRFAASRKPSRRQVALFAEFNAVSLRSETARRWVSQHNREFFTALGEKLKAAFDAPDADAYRLGLLAQSLHVGLLIHGAFENGGFDEDTVADLYELLAVAADRHSLRPAVS